MSTTTTSTGAELQDQGVKLFMQHEYEAAADVFKQAQAAYDAEGKKDLAAEMQVNLGLIDRALGNYDDAVKLMTGAQQVFHDMNDRSREAQVIGNLGGTYLAQGNSEQAVTLYRDAADTFRELKDEERYGQTLMAIADVQMKSGKLGEAMITYEIALENIQNPNFRQKLLKGLINVKNRVAGGGAPVVDKSE
jgi:tetratricopeptide (TPR) repeat protein